VSASAAYAVLEHQFHVSAYACELRETLAYWSSDFPASTSPQCVPQPGPVWNPPPACAREIPKPWYQHVLAWVFTWRTDCIVLGPVRQPGAAPIPTAPPLSCRAITFVDASTGQLGSMYEGGL
jgi:hypothetical protein